jgi:hypothetical protein
MASIVDSDLPFLLRYNLYGCRATDLPNHQDYFTEYAVHYSTVPSHPKALATGNPPPP